MAVSSKVECGFCFHTMKIKPVSVVHEIKCKRCGEKINWQEQVDIAILDKIHPKLMHVKYAEDSDFNHEEDYFSQQFIKMPWEVRLVAIIHGLILLLKGGTLLLVLITVKMKSPADLIYNIFYIAHSIYTFYGIHYRSRLTWLWLKNISKFFMYFFSLLGLLFVLMAMARPIILTFLPVYAFIWLYFSIDYLLLRRPSSRKYFRVICPRCSSLKSKAGDNSFRTVKCKECGFVWE